MLHPFYHEVLPKSWAYWNRPGHQKRHPDVSKHEVLYLALLTTEGLLPKSSSAETLDGLTYLASIPSIRMYTQKQPLLGTRQHPCCYQQPQQIVGSGLFWQKTCVPNSSFYPTVLQVVSYQEFLVMKLNKHLRLSRASRPYDHWYPRGILDFRCLRWSQRNQGPVLRYSPQPPEAFVPPVRQQKHHSLNCFRSVSDLVAIRRYLFTPQR